MTVITALLGLSILVVVHEMGHMLAAKAMGVRVNEFGVGFGPALLKKKIGKTVYSLRIIFLGGFVKMAGMDDDEQGPHTYNSKPAWRRALIIVAGPLANVLAAVLILTGIYMAGVPTGAKPEVQSVIPGTFAAQAGVQPGDRLVSLNGVKVNTWEEFVQTVQQQKPGASVTLVVDRGGQLKQFSGTLTADPRKPALPRVGVQPAPVETRYSPPEALWRALEANARIVGALGTVIGQLVNGQQSFSSTVAGPVGIVSIVGSAATIKSFLFFLALISIQLAIFNLLPLLPLDGGHLFFIAAEKVIGRPVRPETIQKVAVVGMALILTLFFFATFTDLSKILSGQPIIKE